MPQIFHPHARGDGLPRAHRSEKFRLHMANWCGEVAVVEPTAPAEPRLADQVLHRAVRQGNGPRIKNDAGRIGVFEAKSNVFGKCRHNDLVAPQSLCLTEKSGRALRQAGRSLILRSMPKRRRRSARRSAWSRRIRDNARRLFAYAAGLCVVAGFCAGYFWQSAKLGTNPVISYISDPPSLVAPAPQSDASGGVRINILNDARVVRAAALDQIDEAIRARHEKRIAGALQALDRARRIDSSTPGLEVAFAEMALEEKQFVEMRAAADAAKRKKQDAAAACVLLGIDKWLSRGPSGQEVLLAAQSASASFAEALDLDFFNPQACFFLGDMLRYAGSEAEGRDRAFASLHRFNAWNSYDIILAKMFFASVENQDPFFGGLGLNDNAPRTRALSALVSTPTSGDGADLTAFSALVAQRTLAILMTDRFLSVLKRSPDTVPTPPELP